MLVNGEQLEADPSGALWWPARRLLAVADLHLEKGSALAGRGALLPPYDSRATLARLAGTAERLAPRLVLCLGDSFHDPEAAARLTAEERRSLGRLMAGRDWLWILGNHDPLPPVGLGGEVAEELQLGGLLFRHDGRAGGPAGEVSGHLHPKAAAVARGRRLVRRCFVADGVRLVLPAFGAYTGGLDVLSAAFRPLFPGPFHAHLLGRQAVHAVPHGRLVPMAGSDGPMAYAALPAGGRGPG